MEKITVLKSNGQLIHQGEFAGQEWLDQNLATNAWGKPAKWLVDFLAEVETREVQDSEGILHLEYLHPAEYSYEIQDITAEYEAEQAYQSTLALGKMAKEVCDEALNYIRGYNITAGFTTEQINQLKTDFALVKEYLTDGQPWGAKAVLLTLDNPTFTVLKNKVLEILSKVTN